MSIFSAQLKQLVRDTGLILEAGGWSSVRMGEPATAGGYFIGPTGNIDGESLGVWNAHLDTVTLVPVTERPEVAAAIVQDAIVRHRTMLVAEANAGPTP